MYGIKKKTALVFLLIVIGTGSAFGLNLSLGASGALYMSGEELASSEGRDIAEQFQSMEGVYFGVNGEILLRKWALGLYTYFSFFESTAYFTELAEMMDLDLNLSLSYHLFGATTILDPFIEIGAGIITRSVTAIGENKFDEPSEILGTNYWLVGAGLGINLGGLGVFTKLQYHRSPSAVEIEETHVGKGGEEYTTTYTLAEYPLNDLKVILGLKLIF